jgi:hypothetical protein
VRLRVRGYHKAAVGGRGRGVDHLDMELGSELAMARLGSAVVEEGIDHVVGEEGMVGVEEDSRPGVEVGEMRILHVEEEEYCSLEMEDRALEWIVGSHIAVVEDMTQLVGGNAVEVGHHRRSNRCSTS